MAASREPPSRPSLTDRGKLVGTLTSQLDVPLDDVRADLRSLGLSRCGSSSPGSRSTSKASSIRKRSTPICATSRCRATATSRRPTTGPRSTSPRIVEIMSASRAGRRRELHRPGQRVSGLRRPERAGARRPGRAHRPDSRAGDAAGARRRAAWPTRPTALDVLSLRLSGAGNVRRQSDAASRDMLARAAVEP